ncbi:MAG: hypothetical protein H0X39_00060 [Actinobacteria bacterium]|nr:hypothetical protein [Actinomycetota bacterium]
MGGPPGLPPGGPPPGMGAPPMGAPPMGGAGAGDPVSALSAAAFGLQQQNEQAQQAATGALQMLGQLLAGQPNDPAMQAQTSPGPLAPNTMGMPGA